MPVEGAIGTVQEDVKENSYKSRNWQTFWIIFYNNILSYIK